LSRSKAFAGLPGVFADALPDTFGNAVIARYFAEKGTPDAALSPIQKLLYIGTRAMGALEFEKMLEGPHTAAIEEALEVAQLVKEARRIIEGDTAVAIPEIMQVGGSAGGARAKALILWNRRLERVRSGFATASPGDEAWMIKFDGVADSAGGSSIRENVRPGPWGRIEYAYSKIARAAGIEMAESHLLHDRTFAHFMTKRFDVDNGARLHMHSLGGLRELDYNISGLCSYEEYFRTIRELGLQQPDVAEGFRRMVFNLAMKNQDDHVKNFSFLMSPNGKWRLAPAFDLCASYGSEWTRTHQMTVNGKNDGFARADLLAVGSLMDLPEDGSRIIDEVMSAADTWKREAKSAKVPKAHVDEIEAVRRRF
ncbi:MAG: type II toxin-antitoxin system HipA family toxin, partial [Gemmatimonadaceae bacterium]